MPLRRYKRPHSGHPFAGTWHITAMELWDDDYIHMERQAFVAIGPDNHGEFQFGLVRGDLDGYFEILEGEPLRRWPNSTGLRSTRFVFTWEGLDELDEVSGSGWMRLKGANEADGVIKFHGGDRSTFRACRAKAHPAG